MVLAGGYARVSGLNLTAPSGSGAVNVVQVSGVAEFQNSHLSIGPDCNGFVATAGGVIKVAYTKVDQSASGNTVGLFSDTNSTIRIGEEVDVDNTSSPLAGSGYFSRGTTITANAARTPQEYSWPDIKSTDRILFRRVSAVGTPTPAPPLYAIAPGVGFTVTFGLYDEFVYEVIII
jgi:hypothetical protein